MNEIFTDEFMHYTIINTEVAISGSEVKNDTSVELSEAEQTFIKQKVDFSLSRFASIISKCLISFVDRHHSFEPHMLACTISIELTNGHELVVSDTDEDLSEAFLLALSRIKRNIDWYLKRMQKNRVSGSLNIKD